MRAQHHDASHRGDPLARGPFTFRRMRPWQIWALGIIAVGGFVAAVVLG